MTTWHRRPLLLALAALALGGLFACSGSRDGEITIYPSSAEVDPGETIRFDAVGATAAHEVNWSVVESGGGVIDAIGQYLAPEVEGTFHVAASSTTTKSGGVAVVSVVRRGVRVAVSPETATVVAGASFALSVKVTGTPNTAVTWSVHESPAGGSVSADGVYVAPATAGIYHVVATSVANPARADYATVTVIAAPLPPPPPPPVVVIVALTPTTASVAPGGTVQFTATVTGSSDVGLTWSVQEGAAGGSVSSTGLYTAPATAGTFHVVATSNADPSKTSVAVVTVTPPPVPPPPPTDNTIAAWVLDGLARIAPTDRAGTVTQVNVSAGRGEHEPFQVVLTAPQGGLSNVRVAVSDLVGPSRISASNLPPFRERYTNITISSPDYWTGVRPLGTGMYADGLIPLTAPFSVAPSTNQPVWIDLFVPRGTPAGVYNGNVTITADQGSATIPVTLNVWAFELPVKPSLKSSFGLISSLMSDAMAQQMLTDHKVMPTWLSATQASALAPRGLNTAGMQFWSNQNGCWIDPAPSAATFQSVAAAYPADLDVYVFVVDEPFFKCSTPSTLYPQLEQWSQNIHQSRAKVLVTSEPRSELLDDGTGQSAVDIWVPVPKLFDPTSAAFQGARARGNEIWSYTALVQDTYSPKWEIDFAPINFRIMPGFISASLDLQGILYWAVDAYYTGDPWNQPYFSGGFPGEGILIYPGQPVGVTGPVASMRLKWIREGIEDFEYVQMLKALGSGAFALQVSRSVGADWSNWTKDPAALQAARTQLGQELDRLSR
jgi:hypothetical protein